MPHAVPPPPFRLTRHFSLTSLVGVVLVMACLLLFYREHTTTRLAGQVGHANADATRLLANMLWPQYRGFVVGAGQRDRAQLLADPRQPQLHEAVRDAMRGLDLVKLKIYDRSGMTVFSTDASQVGELHAANPLLQTALRGQVASVFTHRDRFHALEGELEHRDLITSYVPISTQRGQPADAVFEVYADVTTQRADEAQAWRLVAVTLLASLGTLYLFLLATVRRADRVMAAQEQARGAHAAEVAQLAYHDGLTGLPNRRSFGARLPQALDQAQQQQHRVALMFMDLDGFKAVNDAHGHAAGDTLLQTLAARLQACLGEGAQLFRMGGDEFTVLLPQVASDAAVAVLAQRLLTAAAQPVGLPGGDLRVGASIGTALYPDHAGLADDLLRCADDAMYVAKARGKGCHAVHGDAAPAAALPAARCAVPSPH